MEQPSYLWMGDNCELCICAKSQLVEHQCLGTPQSISRERQFVDSGPRSCFRQGEINNIITFDLHTESEYYTTSGTVTARQNTERDTIGQSERPHAPGGIEEVAMWKGKQRGDAPSPPSWPPLEDAGMLDHTIANLQHRR
ncbi:hypothetical protein HYPSUDRAFT_976627 [Hypholoma sublateritium FD-334 SS-4]|uniref:Uncharacterized protein n=1 Tax=Hypholoma sublateritium (strain FD-334 SS-4) TaxID=945553 RepID=A0A0D2NG18_HYPSF|nr:hypothetical protein HYPSUDRAFT_976627 [Hypholoma sublateritium FD-334 SS-4]